MLKRPDVSLAAALTGRADFQGKRLPSSISTSPVPYSGGLLSSASNPQEAMNLILSCIKEPPCELTDLLLKTIQQLQERIAQGGFQSVSQWNAYLATLARLKAIFVISTMGDDKYTKKFLPLFKNSEQLTRYQLPVIADYIMKQRAAE